MPTTQIARPGNFSIPFGESGEDCKTFSGWIIENGHGVGGFDDPWFEKNEALKMEEGMLIYYNEKRDAFIDYSSSDGEEYPAQQVQTTEGLKTLYQIGAGGFVWKEEVAE